MTRRELKLKILGTYGSVSEFCKIIGYSKAQISNILARKSAGSIEFWNYVHELLDMSLEDLWECQKDNERYGNKETKYGGYKK